MAYVLSRKGVLVSCPDVQKMTPAQWLFEYVALHKKERETAEIALRSFKNVLVSVLGLNALRPMSDKGIPKKWEEMSEDERETFLPLVAWVGHSGLLEKVNEQLKTEQVIQETENSKAYEDMVAAIDATGGDMEPILGPLNPQAGKRVPAATQQSESGIKIDVKDV